MISFEPRVGKAQTSQTSGRFAVIIPKYFLSKKKNITTRVCFHNLLLLLCNISDYIIHLFSTFLSPQYFIPQRYNYSILSSSFYFDSFYSHFIYFKFYFFFSFNSYFAHTKKVNTLSLSLSLSLSLIFYLFLLAYF